MHQLRRRRHVGPEHLGLCAMKNSMLLILNISICLIPVAIWRRPVIPNGFLLAKSVNTEPYLSHTVSDITGEKPQGSSTRRGRFIEKE